MCWLCSDLTRLQSSVRQLLTALINKSYVVSDSEWLDNAVAILTDLLTPLTTPGRKIHNRRKLVKRHTNSILRQRKELIRRKKRLRRLRRKLASHKPCLHTDDCQSEMGKNIIFFLVHFHIFTADRECHEPLDAQRTKVPVQRRRSRGHWMGRSVWDCPMFDEGNAYVFSGRTCLQEANNFLFVITQFLCTSIAVCSFI